MKTEILAIISWFSPTIFSYVLRLRDELWTMHLPLFPLIRVRLIIFGDFLMMLTDCSLLKINVDKFFTDLFYYIGKYLFSNMFSNLLLFLGLMTVFPCCYIYIFMKRKSGVINYSEMMTRYRPRLNNYVDWSLLNFQH